MTEYIEREALLARIKKYAEDVCGAWAVGNALSKRNACCRGVCINVLRYVEQPQEQSLSQLRREDGRR